MTQYLLSALLSVLSLAHSTPITAESLYSIQTKSNDGTIGTLEPYRGKVILVVNTASECGFTPQYKSLEALYEKYKKDGLVVLGFPSNDFGQQEPGTDEQIRFFCKSNYHVTFPIYSKVKVLGSNATHLYQWLIQNTVIHEPISWNFEKFLINRQGHVVRRFKSEFSPDSPILISSIEKELSEKR